eukprot:34838-Chlamydomonas_euryale.AAC.4
MHGGRSGKAEVGLGQGPRLAWGLGHAEVGMEQDRGWRGARAEDVGKGRGWPWVGPRLAWGMAEVGVGQGPRLDWGRAEVGLGLETIASHLSQGYGVPMLTGVSMRPGRHNAARHSWLPLCSIGPHFDARHTLLSLCPIVHTWPLSVAIAEWRLAAIDTTCREKVEVYRQVCPRGEVLRGNAGLAADVPHQQDVMRCPGAFRR